MNLTSLTKLAAAAALVMFSAFSISPVLAADQVNIAYQPLVTIPQGAMKNQKWFEDATKTSVEWKNFSSGGDVNTAFAAGAVDIGLVGLPAFVSGVAQGIPYKLIMLYDIPGTMSGLVVREGTGIKSVADLKGKRVGVPFGSGSDYLLQGALDANGLTSDDVTLVNLQPQPIVAAWTTGQIDAAYIWAPILTQLIEQNGSLILNDGEMADKGYFAGDVAVVSDKFAAEHPDLVQAWVEQNLRAVNWVNSDDQAALDAMMKEYELTADQLKQAALPPAAVFPGRDEQLTDLWFGNGAKGIIGSSTRIGEFLKANKLITTAPTEAQLTERVDPGFLEKATTPKAP